MATMFLKVDMETGADVTVEATITGAFAVHHSVSDQGEESDYYTLTHVPSKRAVVQGLYSFWDAFSLAKTLNNMHISWKEIDVARITDTNFADYMTASQYKKIGALVRKYYRKSAWVKKTD